MELERFVGQPYREPFGCFMLVRDILADRGVEIPDYSLTVTAAEQAAALQRLLRVHAVAVDDPARGDVVLLRLRGHPAHIGVLTSPTEMIHSTSGLGAHLDRIDSVRWARRIDSTWRVHG